MSSAPSELNPVSANRRGNTLPADALPNSWVDFAPAILQPWLRLMRFDRPIGAILLFLPCVFGLAAGAAAQARGFGSQSGDFVLLALFGAGAIVMRGAGCTYNDIIDRDIDAKVARTRGRPIPSGAVSVTGAWIFLALQLAGGLAILLQLNRFSIWLGAGSLVPIALYPFMKRITWWPQAWLGITFNWGALLGFAAETGHLALPAYLLYAGCFFWTLGYDTIYAHQDKEDDALIGVRSTARLFGVRSRQWIDAFYALALACMVAALIVVIGRLWLALLLVPVALHFYWQSRRLDIDDAQRCLKIFRANRNTGLLLAAAIIAASWLG
ncbi:MAG TPA: 4-hydroxybenzoate octaprenyltransferase [Rhizomicrobium sp.]|jgi:4-hydroxybenzoate polyprenyltransferase|nr:4-hydroxybenzoate octaprenyltransferase [Rhizomicrobium sp.]